MKPTLVAGVVLVASSGCNEIAGIHEAAGELDGSPAVLGASGSAALSGDPSTSSPGSTLQPSTPPTDAGTTLHAWADWVMPNPASAGLPNPQKYDAGAAGLVYDENTGLTWQAVPPPDAYRWQDALAYCASLTLSGGGFRLPSRVELISLIDYTRAPATIDVAAFPNTAQDYFWSGSLFASDASYAWAVTFNFSVSPVEYDSISTQYRVRCVRP